MPIGLALALLVGIIVVGIVSVRLSRRAPRVWAVTVIAVTGGFMFLYRPIADFLEPWLLERMGEVSVQGVLSGRELVISERHIVLVGTRLPEREADRQAARAGLQRLLDGTKQVTLRFPVPVRGTREPWPAVVSQRGVCLNERMLSSGLLLPDGTLGAAAVSVPAAPLQRNSAAGEPAGSADSTQPASWGRWLLWGLAGLLGAVALGRLMNKQRGWWLPLLLVVGLAARSIALSVQSGATVWPPVICLALAVLFAGRARRANLEAMDRFRARD